MEKPIFYREEASIRDFLQFVLDFQPKGKRNWKTACITEWNIVETKKRIRKLRRKGNKPEQLRVL